MRFSSRRSEFFRIALKAMDSLLPPTGTTALVNELSTHVPDDFINQLLPASRGRGRRRQFSPAQLDRKGTRLKSSHQVISYAVFCLKKKKTDDRKYAPCPFSRRSRYY